MLHIVQQVMVHIKLFHDTYFIHIAGVSWMLFIASTSIACDTLLVVRVTSKIIPKKTAISFPGWFWLNLPEVRRDQIHLQPRQWSNHNRQLWPPLLSRETVNETVNETENSTCLIISGRKRSIVYQQKYRVVLDTRKISSKSINFDSIAHP